MTENEIRKKLGLMPKELWVHMAITKNIKNLTELGYDIWDPKTIGSFADRGTGKTTNMIICALSVLSNGASEIRISAWWPVLEEIFVEKAKGMAVKLGLDPDKIVGNRGPKNLNIDDSHSFTFCDHFKI